MANSFNLDSLGHNEVHDFLAEITKQLDSALPKGKEDAKSFLNAVEKFDNAWDRTKDDELIALDAAADMAWVDFNAFLIGVVNYPDSNVSGAAAEIKDAFDEFEDPTELPYEQEYAILADLIAKLDAISDAIRKESLCQPFIDQLKQRCDAFNKLFRERQLAGTEGDFIRAKEARAEVNREYSQFMEKIYRSSNDKVYGDFTTSLNDLISKPLSGAKRRRAVTD
ncbi:MAG: hypothetical protein J6A01_11495 [Proteobacteria bacterium]|nr:hypothetical protein [Pseudomonadota bacterium]